MTDIVAEATRKWTPYQIELMLHYHVSAAPFIRWNAPAFGETVGDLVARGLLKATSKPYCYDTTDAGTALVEAWCSTDASDFEDRRSLQGEVERLSHDLIEVLAFADECSGAALGIALDLSRKGMELSSRVRSKYAKPIEDVK